MPDYRNGIKIVDIGDYERDPNVYHKHDYDPFGNGSSTWRLFYMKYRTRRGNTRAYRSYGRDYAEALRGLEVATGKTGFIKISVAEYNKLGGEIDE